MTDTSTEAVERVATLLDSDCPIRLNGSTTLRALASERDGCCFSPVDPERSYGRVLHRRLPWSPHRKPVTRNDAAAWKVCFQAFRDKIPRDRICPTCGRIVTRYHEHFKAPIIALPKIKVNETDG